jgi:hypothetical protein
MVSGDKSIYVPVMDQLKRDQFLGVPAIPQWLWHMRQVQCILDRIVAYALGSQGELLTIAELSPAEPRESSSYVCRYYLSWFNVSESGKKFLEALSCMWSSIEVWGVLTMMLTCASSTLRTRPSAPMLKGVSHEIFRVLFWHVWIDLGLYKNLWLFLIFSVEPLILFLRLKFKRG